MNADAIWSAGQAAAASCDFAELHAGHGGLVWVEFDPASSRSRLLHWRDGQPLRELAPGWSVRSRVYEYGGGACCLTTQGVAFVNEQDQQLHHLQLPNGTPQPLTGRSQCRYGDLHWVAAWQALLAVEESREAEAVVHRLVAVGLDGQRRVLVEGADFYAAPRTDGAAQQLFWIEWSRPDQPWTRTRLRSCTLSTAGDCGEARTLAGEQGEESLQQPRLDAGGRLFCLSDRLGFWQPFAWDGQQLQRQLDNPHDHAPAPWQLGVCSYLPLADGQLLLSRQSAESGQLLLRRADGSERRLALPFSRFRALASDGQRFYCVAAAPDRLPAVLAIEAESGDWQVLAGGALPLPAQALSQPQAICCSSAGELTRGYFYPAVTGDAPGPLVVFLHGGPTSVSYPVFDPRIAFWTLRGFAVLDLNYRGSAGYGRAYRQRLEGAWGQIELQDIRAAVDHLASAGRIRADQVFVRGASAGGYSALLALAEGGYAGGASLYGVSDPLALRRLTHKFEADYLDWLLGDPAEQGPRYARRTPLLQAGRIRVPVIFFQGGRDVVVVPEQTEQMVAALRANQVAVACRVFADEGHGFRQAAHLAEALQMEFEFYRECLSSADCKA